MTKSEAQEFARMNNMMSLETSAKTQAGVQDAFAEMVQKVRILRTPHALFFRDLSHPAAFSLSFLLVYFNPCSFEIDFQFDRRFLTTRPCWTSRGQVNWLPPVPVETRPPPRRLRAAIQKAARSVWVPTSRHRPTAAGGATAVHDALSGIAALCCRV